MIKTNDYFPTPHTTILYHKSTSEKGYLKKAAGPSSVRASTRSAHASGANAAVTGIPIPDIPQSRTAVPPPSLVVPRTGPLPARCFQKTGGLPVSRYPESPPGHPAIIYTRQGNERELLPEAGGESVTPAALACFSDGLVMGCAHVRKCHYTTYKEFLYLFFCNFL